MKIIERIIAKKDMFNSKPVTIAFLGDSVTQGCFECFINETNNVDTVFDTKNAYSTRLKEMLNMLYPQVQINIINSGISGDNATNGLKRLNRDVLEYKPDLVIVSYGLNDTCSSTKEDYNKELCGIFERLKQSGTEFIFLTQNAMCTKTSCHLTNDLFKGLSKSFTEIQNSGKLKEYFDLAKESCKNYGGKICDLYSVWEKMIESGVDITELLANKLNHPIREFHYYMAIKLIETMFE